MATKRDERRTDGSADPLPEEEPVVEDEDGMQDPDPVTRREAWEQELAEEGRSEEGAEVGEHLD
jgi:hypothetical protein